MDSLHLVCAPRHLEGLDIDLDVKTPKKSDTHTPICQKRSVAAKGLGQNPLIMFLRSENLEFRQHIVLDEMYIIDFSWFFIFVLEVQSYSPVRFISIQWYPMGVWSRCFNFDPVPQVFGYLAIGRWGTDMATTGTADTAGAGPSGQVHMVSWAILEIW